MAVLIVAATLLELEAALGWTGQPLPAGEGLVVRLDLPAIPGGVLATATGIGPVNAAFGLGMALACHRVRGVLNLGLAGSFDSKRLPLGSLAVAASETWPEFGLYGEAGLDPRGLKLAQAQTPDGPVFGRIGLNPSAAASAMGLHLPGWPSVHGLTVAGVSGCATRAQELRARHAADMESMEGFALALGCLRAGLPFLEIRSISNFVGLRPPQGWDMPLALRALERAARTLLTPAPVSSGQEEMP
ncbi:futalosine hydrolase [Desulfocurvibacter africanus PCS]|uniref:Futalosine hydrolase n=1 Tax=Desulfocurvibacter africanus PCS TaxID=1262666 RepID=M5PR91_DESAF|nr:futalosine hydrolase [Desulfocurvibacter africanus]EMG36907.1 futalosine hydrolase [Desulfocurvibacter africanus PCS]